MCARAGRWGAPGGPDLQGCCTSFRLLSRLVILKLGGSLNHIGSFEKNPHDGLPARDLDLIGLESG